MNPLTHGTMPAGWKAPQDDLANEVTIWQNEIQEGWWNKKTVQAQVITNKRIILNVSSVILLQDLVSVTSLNSHRETKGQGARVYARGTGMSYGNSKYSGSTYGDVVFVDNRSNQITFNNVPDPSGVVRLVKSTSKGLIDMMKKKPKPELYNENNYYEDQDNKFTGGRIHESEHPYEASPSSPLVRHNEFITITAEQIQKLNESRLKSGEVTSNTPRCPKDGMLHYNSCAFCCICGTKLVRKIGEMTNLPVSDGVPVSYCPKDGMVHYSEMMKYCGLCGGELKFPDPNTPDVISNNTKKCGKCDHNNASGSSFCNSCGFTLR